MADRDGLTIITGIHFAKSTLKLLNNITFLFDPSWEAGANSLPTFPVSFFHIKTIHEIGEAEVSEKPLLFYNSQATVNADSVSGGVLNVVADNITIKPKRYNLEVIIPYSNLSLLQTSYALNPSQYDTIMRTLSSANGESSISFNVPSYLSVYVNLIKSLLNTLIAADFSSEASFVQSVISTPEYNKNSLEAMWRNRAVLKFKNWNDWRYRYVVLTSYDITKAGDEDGVFEATLTLRELPVLTVRNDAGIKKPLYTNPVLKAAGNAIKTVLNGKEGN